MWHQLGINEHLVGIAYHVTPELVELWAINVQIALCHRHNLAHLVWRIFHRFLEIAKWCAVLNNSPCLGLPPTQNCLREEIFIVEHYLFHLVCLLKYLSNSSLKYLISSA